MCVPLSDILLTGSLMATGRLNHMLSKVYVNRLTLPIWSQRPGISVMSNAANEYIMSCQTAGEGIKRLCVWDCLVKSYLFILTVHFTPNSDGANVGDRLNMTVPAKPFIKE